MALGFIGTGLGMAWRAVSATGGFAWRNKLLTGAAITDWTMFRGRGTGWVADKAQGLAGTAWDYATNEERRPEIEQGLEGIRGFGDNVLSTVSNPGAAVQRAIGGDGQSGGGLLGSVFNFFKKDNGDVNWMTTLLTGAAAWWGGSKLKDAFSGGGGGGGWSKLLMLGVIAGALYAFREPIMKFAGDLKNRFTGASNQTSEQSTGVPLSGDPTGRTNPTASVNGSLDLSDFARTASTSAPAPATTSAALARPEPQGELGRNAFSQSARPQVTVDERDLGRPAAGEPHQEVEHEHLEAHQ